MKQIESEPWLSLTMKERRKMQAVMIACTAFACSLAIGAFLDWLTTQRHSDGVAALLWSIVFLMCLISVWILDDPDGPHGA